MPLLAKERSGSGDSIDSESYSLNQSWLVGYANNKGNADLLKRGLGAGRDILVSGDRVYIGKLADSSNPDQLFRDVSTNVLNGSLTLPQSIQDAIFERVNGTLQLKKNTTLKEFNNKLRKVFGDTATDILLEKYFQSLCAPITHFLITRTINDGRLGWVVADIKPEDKSEDAPRNHAELKLVNGHVHFVVTEKRVQLKSTAAADETMILDGEAKTVFCLEEDGRWEIRDFSVTGEMAELVGADDMYAALFGQESEAIPKVKKKVQSEIDRIQSKITDFASLLKQVTHYASKTKISSSRDLATAVAIELLVKGCNGIQWDNASYDKIKEGKLSDSEWISLAKMCGDSGCKNKHRFEMLGHEREIGRFAPYIIAAAERECQKSALGSDRRRYALAALEAVAKFGSTAQHLEETRAFSLMLFYGEWKKLYTTKFGNMFGDMLGDSSNEQASKLMQSVGMLLLRFAKEGAIPVGLMKVVQDACLGVFKILKAAIEVISQRNLGLERAAAYFGTDVKTALSWLDEEQQKEILSTLAPEAAGDKELPKVIEFGKERSKAELEFAKEVGRIMQIYGDDPNPPTHLHELLMKCREFVFEYLDKVVYVNKVGLVTEGRDEEALKKVAGNFGVNLATAVSWLESQQQEALLEHCTTTWGKALPRYSCLQCLVRVAEKLDQKALEDSHLYLVTQPNIDVKQRVQYLSSILQGKTKEDAVGMVVDSVVFFDDDQILMDILNEATSQNDEMMLAFCRHMVSERIIAVAKKKSAPQFLARCRTLGFELKKAIEFLGAYSCKLMSTSQDRLNGLEVGFYSDNEKIYCKIEGKKPLLVDDAPLIAMLTPKFREKTMTFTEEERAQALKFTSNKGYTLLGLDILNDLLINAAQSLGKVELKQLADAVEESIYSIIASKSLLDDVEQIRVGLQSVCWSLACKAKSVDEAKDYLEKMVARTGMTARVPLVDSDAMPGNTLGALWEERLKDDKNGLVAKFCQPYIAAKVNALFSGGNADGFDSGYGKFGLLLETALALMNNGNLRLLFSSAMAASKFKAEDFKKILAEAEGAKRAGCLTPKEIKQGYLRLAFYYVERGEHLRAYEYFAQSNHEAVENIIGGKYPEKFEDVLKEMTLEQWLAVAKNADGAVDPEKLNILINNFLLVSPVLNSSAYFYSNQLLALFSEGLRNTCVEVIKQLPAFIKKTTQLTQVESVVQQIYFGMIRCTMSTFLSSSDEIKAFWKNARDEVNKGWIVHQSETMMTNSDNPGVRALAASKVRKQNIDPQRVVDLLLDMELHSRVCNPYIVSGEGFKYAEEMGPITKNSRPIFIRHLWYLANEVEQKETMEQVRKVVCEYVAANLNDSILEQSPIRTDLLKLGEEGAELFTPNSEIAGILLQSYCKDHKQVRENFPYLALAAGNHFGIQSDLSNSGITDIAKSCQEFFAGTSGRKMELITRVSNISDILLRAKICSEILFSTEFDQLPANGMLSLFTAMLSISASEAASLTADDKKKLCALCAKCLAATKNADDAAPLIAVIENIQDAGLKAAICLHLLTQGEIGRLNKGELTKLLIGIGVDVTTEQMIGVITHLFDKYEKSEFTTVVSAIVAAPNIRLKGCVQIVRNNSIFQELSPENKTTLLGNIVAYAGDESNEILENELLPKFTFAEVVAVNVAAYDNKAGNAIEGEGVIANKQRAIGLWLRYAYNYRWTGAKTEIVNAIENKRILVKDYVLAICSFFKESSCSQIRFGLLEVVWSTMSLDERRDLAQEIISKKTARDDINKTMNFLDLPHSEVARLALCDAELVKSMSFDQVVRLWMEAKITKEVLLPFNHAGAEESKVLIAGIVAAGIDASRIMLGVMSYLQGHKKDIPQFLTKLAENGELREKLTTAQAVVNILEGLGRCTYQNMEEISYVVGRDDAVLQPQGNDGIVIKKKSSSEFVVHYNKIGSDGVTTEHCQLELRAGDILYDSLEKADFLFESDSKDDRQSAVDLVHNLFTGSSEVEVCFGSGKPTTVNYIRVSKSWWQEDYYAERYVNGKAEGKKVKISKNNDLHQLLVKHYNYFRKHTATENDQVSLNVQRATIDHLVRSKVEALGGIVPCTASAAKVSFIQGLLNAQWACPALQANKSKSDEMFLHISWALRNSVAGIGPAIAVTKGPGRDLLLSRDFYVALAAHHLLKKEEANQVKATLDKTAAAAVEALVKGGSWRWLSKLRVGLCVWRSQFAPCVKRMQAQMQSSVVAEPNVAGLRNGSTKGATKAMMLGVGGECGHGGGGGRRSAKTKQQWNLRAKPTDAPEPSSDRPVCSVGRKVG